MNKKALRGSLLLALGAIIWGCAFVAQNVGMDYVGPFTFNGARSFIGTLTLLPIVLVRRSNRRKTMSAAEWTINCREQLKAGLLAGLAIFVPTSLQQIGLQYTSAGKSGFITAMYIVVVPIMAIFLGKRARLNVWISVAVAVVGMYLLCVTETLSISNGDIVTLISVVFWGVQILVIDRFAPKVDCIEMVCCQFLVCGLLSLAPMLILERPSLPALGQCIIPLLYTGVMSSGIAYSLQSLGQRDTHPTVAALIMSLESVFAALAGFVILGDSFSQRELIGCGLMFAAVLIAQLPPAGRKKSAVRETE